MTKQLASEFGRLIDQLASELKYFTFLDYISIENDSWKILDVTVQEVTFSHPWLA